MAKQTMSVREANEYLADVVADYILGGLPLQHLTGQEGGGRPDRRHVLRLREALMKLGHRRAAEMLPADTGE